MNVIDNFLPDHIHKRIESNLLGPHFPWNFNTGTVYGSDCGLEDFQFVHDFYAPISGPVSNYYNLIDSIIDLLGVKYLVRVKANAAYSLLEILAVCSVVLVRWMWVVAHQLLTDTAESRKCIVLKSSLVVSL